MMKYKLTLAVMTVGLAIELMPAALADTVNFTLTQPALSGRPGNTVTFEATVSAPITNGADIFLNGDDFNIASPLALNDSDFFANAPFFLAPGDSSTFDIFTVAIPVGTPLGIYLGSLTILGGANDSSRNNLGTKPFSVAVTPDITASPEPSSLILLGSGLAGLVGVVRCKRSM